MNPFGNRTLVGITDKPMAEVFCLAYANTVNINTTHRAFRPC